MADFVRWFRAQYLGTIGLDSVEGGPAFKKFLDTANQLKAPALSGVLRASRYNQLRFRYPLGPQGYIAAVLSVSWGDSAHPIRMIAGYAWWRAGTGGEFPEYICAGYTFDSRDGEYRAPLIRGVAFREIFDGVAPEEEGADVPEDLREGFAALLAPIEERILLLAAKGVLRLSADVLPESVSGDTLVGLDRLPLEVLTVLLARDGRGALGGTLEQHASPTFSRLVHLLERESPGLLAGIAPEKYHSFATFSLQGDLRLAAVTCGQKLTPMTLREVMAPWDATYPSWRELLAADIASDLVLNKVAPCFVFSNQWTYVGAEDRDDQQGLLRLYENPAMHEKFARSVAADLATDSLRTARREARGATSDAAAPAYHLAEFDAHVYESIEYAQSYLVQSGVSLVRTMEHGGLSLGSFAHRVRMAPLISPVYTRLFADHHLAAGFVFGLAYGCHCLHARAGIIHTDIHRNNVVVYETGVAFHSEKPRPAEENAAPTYTRIVPEDTVLAYVLSRGERDTYLFETEGLTGCIIDFSRAILGPGEAEKRLETRHGARYITLFRRDQAGRMLRTLHRYAPAFVTANQERIKAALLSAPEKGFKILAAVDFIAIGRMLGEYLAEASKLKSDALRPFAVSDEAVKLARRLEKTAREFLIVRLGDLLENPSGAVDEYPGDTVLPNVFGAYTYSRRMGANPTGERPALVLADVWNFARPLTWSGSDYAKFPPWARLDEIEKHLGGEKLTAFIERGAEPFLEALRPAPAVRVLADRVRAELDARDGPAVSTQSSWVND